MADNENNDDPSLREKLKVAVHHIEAEEIYENSEYAKLLEKAGELR